MTYRHAGFDRLKKLDPVNVEFGKLVQRKRLALGMSQIDLAIEAGLTAESIISYVEHGGGPRLTNAIAIARYLDIDLNDLKLWKSRLYLGVQRQNDTGNIARGKVMTIVRKIPRVNVKRERTQSPISSGWTLRVSAGEPITERYCLEWGKYPTWHGTYLKVSNGKKCLSFSTSNISVPRSRSLSVSIWDMTSINGFPRSRLNAQDYFSQPKDDHLG